MIMFKGHFPKNKKEKKRRKIKEHVKFGDKL
jgi:hypothetical protein